TKSARSDESARRIGAIALGGPHLMLSHVGDDNAILRQSAKQFIQEADGQLREAARIKLRAVRATSHRAPAAPIRQLCITNFATKRGNRLRQVADHWQFARTYSVKLSRIDFEVNDLCIRRKTGRVACDAIV